jgi:hypothetical protein
MTVRWRAPSVVARIRLATNEALFAGGQDVLNTARNLILNSPASGEFYVRRGVEHQSSAPGEPPANWTGALIRNLRAEVDTRTRRRDLPSRIRIVADVEYGEWLEVGTRRMKPRPFIRPALLKNHRKIQGRVSRAIAVALATPTGGPGSGVGARGR